MITHRVDGCTHSLPEPPRSKLTVERVRLTKTNGNNGGGRKSGLTRNEYMREWKAERKAAGLPRQENTTKEHRNALQRAARARQRAAKKAAEA